MAIAVPLTSRRQLIGAAALGWLTSCATGQQDPAAPASKLRVATVVLVRHAEKSDDDPTDPGLTQRGESRATALAEMLHGAGVSALFTSDYRRTRDTLEPVSKRLELPLTEYDAAKSTVLAKRLGELESGAVAVVAGHSNTVPAIVRALGAELSNLTARGHFADDEYDRVVVVNLCAVAAEPLRAVQVLDLRLPLPA